MTALILEGGVRRSCWAHVDSRYLASWNGYNGVLSVEHEDGAVGREEGFLSGKKYLEQYFVPGVA